MQKQMYPTRRVRTIAQMHTVSPVTELRIFTPDEDLYGGLYGNLNASFQFKSTREVEVSCGFSLPSGRAPRCMHQS
jgi:hypothetical protein